ncbi:DUF370 domain-containing protein [Kosmotoga olearia]|jgi:hypothetical protein|uniref:Regulatory protein n=2 Tax=Kosmotoga TaxID=651456 RepID=C5CI96_KOSOT|nr:DUF370 domain-containing protein [Kosmotoga olearia]ACR80798.1 protein of unknown function DUF370 [Kosmotoga olearia TBF 19.5.1]MDI3523968.1 hypothetical protein [Kosmotoga sp.]MDK2952719.1 hypothetical protein [Kosmotoga sp.]
MMERIVNIGFDSFVVTDRIMAVLPAQNSVVKRLKQMSVEIGRTINLTFGKCTRSVIITDSGHLIFSFVPVEKLIEKLFDGEER